MNTIELNAIPRAQISAVIAALAARLLEPVVQEATRPEVSATDALLTAEQIAERLGVSAKWIYRHLRKQPFARKLGGTWRFGEQGFERWLARQRA